MTTENNEIQLGRDVLELIPVSDNGVLIKALHHRIAEILNEERKACSEIALAIDSGRGNEKEIAKSILGRGKVNNSVIIKVSKES